MFEIGDTIYLSPNSIKYTVKEIDNITGPIPKYKLADQEEFEFWDYCIGWEKAIQSEEVLKKGEILIKDEFFEVLHDWEDEFDFAIQIRIIKYENHIYYCKLINDILKEFKELK